MDQPLPELPKPRLQRRLHRKTRWYPDTRLLRLGHISWTADEAKTPAATLSLALTPQILHWRRENYGWLLTIAGVRLHYRWT